MPFILMEATYEGEYNASEVQVRRQAYFASLCGAFGQFMGNNPLWPFDGPEMVGILILGILAYLLRGAESNPLLDAPIALGPHNAMAYHHLVFAIITSDPGNVAAAQAAIKEDLRTQIIM